MEKNLALTFCLATSFLFFFYIWNLYKLIEDL